MMQRFHKWLATFNFSNGQITSLLEFCTVKSYKKGDFLLKEGEDLEGSFFVENGLLRTYVVGNNDKEHILMFASEGWIATDRAALYLNEPAEINVQALEETDIVVIRKGFNRLASEYKKDYGAYLEFALQKHILQIQRRVVQLLAHSAEERYLTFINTYPDLLNRVPLWMIASYLGLTPESLSRVRKDLTKKKSS